MKKIVLILIAITVTSYTLSAQTATDALRYSYLDVAGTGRSLGVGGAIGALGADYATLSTNPAGLASYRTSEFVITPSLYIPRTASTLEGEEPMTFNESVVKFNLSNVGVVLSTRPIASKWKTFNVGIGLNQVANFNQKFFYEGNTTGSYTDRFVELANDENGNGVSPDELDDFEAGLAFSTGAIYDADLNPNDAVYFWTNDFQLDRDASVLKNQLVKSSGSINELVFAFAGNYNEKLMIGATVGVPFLRFVEEKVYTESDDVDEVAFFDELEFRENLTTSGIGINLKLGMIYRINQMFRIGAAVHTPTAFSLTDNYSSSMLYGFTIDGNSQQFEAESPDGTFDYKLKTPWRYLGSAGVIIPKFGFVSAEVEYVDYTGSTFDLTASSSNLEDREYQEEVNAEIINDFNSAINIRLGAEYAYGKLRFRAGYGINGTPYAEDDITNNSYSLGIGLRQRSFYMDLGYKRSSVDEGYVPYRMDDLSKQQLVNNTIDNDRFLLTFGFKF